jgi:PDZ domain
MDLIELQRRADSGSCVAQTILGVYLDGIGTETNPEAAHHYLHATALQGESRTIVTLGACISRVSAYQRTFMRQFDGTRALPLLESFSPKLRSAGFTLMASGSREIQPPARKWFSVAIKQQSCREPKWSAHTQTTITNGRWLILGRLLVVGSVVLGVAVTICAQQKADPYVTGITLFSSQGCPMFVGGVTPGSPADLAGIRPGDLLLAVAGTHVGDLKEAAGLMRSSGPKQVSFVLLRGGREIAVVSEVEKRSSIYARIGKKIISDAVVPVDTTQEEVDRMMGFDGQRFLARVFPTHYPAGPELFYAGFEIFILRDPMQVTVGGIEDGPASKAGVHWGDVLLSVNGTPVSGKTPSELEQLFTATQPVTIRLQIDRLGSTRTFDMHLAKAEDVARQNGKRFVKGKLVPIWVTDADLHCFLN